jgi:hypothetical protein
MNILSRFCPEVKEIGERSVAFRDAPAHRVHVAFRDIPHDQKRRNAIYSIFYFGAVIAPSLAGRMGESPSSRSCVVSGPASMFTHGIELLFRRYQAG